MPALRKPGARTRTTPRRRPLPRWARIRWRVALPLLAVAALAAGGLWLFDSDAGQHLTARARTGVLNATAHAGLVVTHVLVTGRDRADMAAVGRALDVKRGMPILAFDPYAARRRLEALPWVRAATVERRLPDTVYVRLAERKPLALWQHSGAFALIDTHGTVITAARLGSYPSLPLVVGAGAPEHALAIIRILNGWPAVGTRVRAIVRVADRRWNLRLGNDVTVRLPETGTAKAVAALSDLISRDRILDRDVVSLDLRLPGRLVVRTAKDGKAHKDSKGSRAHARGHARET